MLRAAAAPFSEPWNLKDKCNLIPRCNGKRKKRYNVGKGRYKSEKRVKGEEA
jgi:hypothetical protein